MNPKSVNTNKGLTERGQEHRSKTAVDGFINVRDIENLME